MNIPMDITEAIKNNKLVFFVGSGFSKTLGCPDWNNLVKDVLKKLKSEDEEYEKLLDAFSFFTAIEILEKIKEHNPGNKRKVYEVLRKIFQLTDEHKNLLDNHRMLGEITTKIITTNYDQSLEEANPNFQKIDQLHEFDLATLDGLENYIFKLHGCISNVSSCVLFKADYDDLYNQNTAAIERLKSIITDQTIIFLGFSLSDPFVKMQFEYINKVYKGLGKTHYFVTTSDNNELKDYGVSPIKLDNWSDIPIFLEMLKKKINY